MRNQSFLVRPITDMDIAAVAKLHREVFHDHFLGMFPEPVIQRFYQSFIVDVPLLVATDHNNQIVGFVMGGETQKLDIARERFFSSEKIRLVLHALVSPALWKPSIVRLSARLANTQRSPATISTTPYRLLSIAVSPKNQGCGVALDLIAAFESSLVNDATYGLSVDARNYRAIAFYKKMGMDIDGCWKQSVFFTKTLASIASHTGEFHDG